MVLPTTSTSALILLIFSLICLGLWPSTFKLAGARWRFELFYVDFAIGALVLSIIAAFTFGTLGSELGFSDRMLVAGRLAQAWVMAGGFVFNVGNMLLVASMSLLGMAAAFPLTIGVALIVSAFSQLRTINLGFLIAGVILLIVALVLDGTACTVRDLAIKPAKAQPKRPVKSPGKKRNVKGLVTGVIGGVIMGVFYPIAAKGMTGDFGLGPYAGVLLFSIGLLISTVIFSFYFMNIAIEGAPIGFSTYSQGNLKQHVTGFSGGILWGAGILFALLGASLPPQVDLDPALVFTLPLASVLLVVLVGVFKWKEFAAAPANAKILLGLAAVLFICGVAALGIGIGR